MKLKQFEGKYLTVSLKLDRIRDSHSLQGILDTSDFPILRIEGKEFREEEVSSVLVGDPANYPCREI
jgi:hypothetical protein